MSALDSIGTTGALPRLSRVGVYDTSSAEGLLELANQHGGSVGEAANELANPRTGILSTIGDGFKNLFKGFIDVISMPSEVVAGLLSSKYTVSQAIEKDIKPSDVIFGAHDKHATTMEKVGSFFVRTATDILLDPLTYVTFGAGGSIAGARGATKIPLAAKAAAAHGVPDATAAVVSKEGQNLYSLFSKVEAQVKGLSKFDELSGAALTAKDIAKKTGLPLSEAYDFTKKELAEVLSETIDAPLNTEFAKRAMTNLLEKYPQLTTTLLDKGGIKVFGQSILSGQRIRSGIQMIPGMTALDHVTQPLRNSVNALFDTSMVKIDNGQWMRMPDEFNWLEQGAKDLAESMKDDRITKLAQIVRANKLDTNEAKFLFAAVEARKLPVDARLANAYKQLMGFNKEEFLNLRRAGIPITFRDKHVPHMLVKSTAKVMPFSLPPSTKVGAAMQRTLDGTVFNADNGALEALEGAVLSKDAEKINQMLGTMRSEGFEIFDDNIVTALARRGVENTKAITTKNFLDALGTNFARTADDAPPGWVGLNLSAFKKEEEFFQKVGMASEALRFHPAVAKKVENFLGAIINDDATVDAMKAYDSIQNFWKASVTSIFPAFHGRNAISNVFMHFNDIGLNSFNPQTHAVAAQLVANDRKLLALTQESMKAAPRAGVLEEISELMTRKVFTDATGNEWTFGELHRVMKNNNIAFNKGLVGALDVNKGTDEMIGALFPVSMKDVKGLAKRQLQNGAQEFVGFKVGREVGRAIEEQARAVDFIVNLKNTGDVTMAAARTKQFLFDYQNLTAFEKTFLRRIMPFYTFTRKNLEMQVNTFLTAPGRTAAAITGVTNIGDALAGDKLTEAEMAALPHWVKAGISILRKKEGNMVEIYSTLGTPIEAAFNSLQPNMMLSSMSPLLRVPIEMGSGYNFFQGKPISEVTNATAFKNAPEPIKQLIGYTEVEGKRSDGSSYKLSMSLRPEMMHLVLNLPPTSRVLSAMKQMEAQDVSTGSKTLQQLIGVRPYAFDLLVEQEKRDRELRAKLETLLTTAGITAKFSKTYVPNPLKVD